MRRASPRPPILRMPAEVMKMFAGFSKDTRQSMKKNIQILAMGEERESRNGRVLWCYIQTCDGKREGM